MLSFESSDVAQVGGLGPAVANLARALSKDSDVSVFMPSHGMHRDGLVRGRLGLEDVPGFISQGARRGADGSHHPYRMGLERGAIAGVKYFLVKGLDQSSSRWLDDPQIYDGELTYQKMSLFARAMREYAYFLPEGASGPEVIHAHDWSVVPAAVALKQALKERNTLVPLVYTIHLLGYKTFDWHYVSEDWCGIRDERQELVLGGVRRSATSREIWEGISGGRIERFGAFEADFVATVSESYLRSEVLPFLGEAGGGKSGVIYNGCDWNEGAIVRSVLKDNRRAMGRGVAGGPTRPEFRKYLLTKALGLTGIPNIPEPEVRQIVSHFSGSGGSLRPFRDDGGLVLFTGRLDRQKGVDVLLRAVPEVLKVFPSTKFLLLMIPLPQRELIGWTIEEASKYEESVRIILGRAPAIYQLAHISADVYAMPSRWEPFGIGALEAMATGNPVVGSRVGGIAETVVDVLERPRDGTGLLVSAEDHLALANGLISFLAVMKFEEGSGRGAPAERNRLLDAIPFEALRGLVAENPMAGSSIRSNCRARVERDFGLENAARMASRAYERALETARGGSARTR
jgi:starch synthase